MSTTLERLRAERQEQAAEEARPPLRSVDSARSRITHENPAPSVNNSLEMCVLRMENYEKCWRLELIDLVNEPQFAELREEYDGLNYARRSKYVFQLTIWKSRNDAMNQIDYRQGFSYRFDMVHSLRLLYGNPVGSMQLRTPIHAQPLGIGHPANVGQARHEPAPPTSNAELVHHTVLQAVSETEEQSEDGSQQTSGTAVDTPPRALSATDEGVVNATPVSKTAKRKAHKGEGDDAPPKKQRK